MDQFRVEVKGMYLKGQKGNHYGQIRISINCNLLMKAKQFSERYFIALQKWQTWCKNYCSASWRRSV